MAREAGGSAFEHPKGSGKFYAKVIRAKGKRAPRKTEHVPGARCLDDAKARAKFATEIVEMLLAAGLGEKTSMLLGYIKSACTEPDARLPIVRKAAAHACASATKSAAGGLVIGLTFQEVGEKWTNGEIHLLAPDHVKKKRTAKDDALRLAKHVYPHLGSYPVASITLQQCEEVLAALPKELSPGSRRHVGQLIAHVLTLAAHPLRAIEASPLPKWFIPKLRRRKAKTWLYPSEDERLLATLTIPLVYRLFFGILSREGMRKGELLPLRWDHLDFENGTIRVDENKTDTARMWVLGKDVLATLKRWKDAHPNTAHVFAGLEKRHLISRDKAIAGGPKAGGFRLWLKNEVKLERAELFESSAVRCPIWLHDLRASFVTLAFATERTEGPGSWRAPGTRRVRCSPATGAPRRRHRSLDFGGGNHSTRRSPISPAAAARPRRRRSRRRPRMPENPATPTRRRQMGENLPIGPRRPEHLPTRRPAPPRTRSRRAPRSATAATARTGARPRRATSTATLSKIDTVRRRPRATRERRARFPSTGPPRRAEMPRFTRKRAGTGSWKPRAIRRARFRPASTPRCQKSKRLTNRPRSHRNGRPRA